MAAETSNATAAVRTEEHPVKRPYVYVFVALAVITVIEVYVSGLNVLANTDRISILVVLAVTKGSLVAGYYMHVRYEPRWLMLIPLAALALVFILVAALTAVVSPAFPVHP